MHLVLKSNKKGVDLARETRVDHVVENDGG